MMHPTQHYPPVPPHYAAQYMMHPTPQYPMHYPPAPQQFMMQSTQYPPPQMMQSTQYPPPQMMRGHAMPATVQPMIVTRPLRQYPPLPAAGNTDASSSIAQQPTSQVVAREEDRTQQQNSPQPPAPPSESNVSSSSKLSSDDVSSSSSADDSDSSFCSSSSNDQDEEVDQEVDDDQVDEAQKEEEVDEHQVKLIKKKMRLFLDSHDKINFAIFEKWMHPTLIRKVDYRAVCVEWNEPNLRGKMKRKFYFTAWGREARKFGFVLDVSLIARRMRSEERKEVGHCQRLPRHRQRRRNTNRIK
eukprot:801162_1